MGLQDKILLIKLKDLGDDRGNLVVVEGSHTIPFEIKRVFFMYGSEKTVVRGQHANKNSEFVLINVSGSSKVRLSDGEEEYIVSLSEPLTGLYIPKMIWKDMFDFSSDSVLLVLASTHYDSSEYIRNYDEYLQTILAQKKKGGSDI